MQSQSVLYAHLHADNRVNEEQHNDEQRHIRQRLERLDERPQQRSYAFAATQEFDESHHTEQPKEVDRNDTRLENKMSMYMRIVCSRLFYLKF